MSLTSDRNDPGLKIIKSDGQQAAYLVLSKEERVKGFVRPVRYKYIHLKCGTETRMGQAISETYSRDPKFYNGTFCCHCGAHFRLQTFEKVSCADCNGTGCKDGTPMRCMGCYGTGEIDEFKWQFEWFDGDPVGSNVEEAEEYLAMKRMEEAKKYLGSGI